MSQLTQGWTAGVWTACVWTAAVIQSLHALVIQYPPVNSTETVACECKDQSCTAVFWFRLGRSGPGVFQPLFYFNNADRSEYMNDTYRDRFKGNRKDGQKTTFFLRIVSVKEEEDAGLYFCLLQYQNRVEPGGPGIDLRPGEKAPTLPSPVKLTTQRAKKPCYCRNWVKDTPRGCSRQVLWPLAGILFSLAILLIGVLFYFSRLPKKCQHNFVKKNQMR